MPWSLYEYLSGRLPKTITETQSQPKDDKTLKISEPDLLTIENEVAFEKRIEFFGAIPSDYRELHSAYVFLDSHRERTFSRKQFTKYCDISPKTVSRYLNLLLKCNLVIKLTGKRKYKVNIK